MTDVEVVPFPVAVAKVRNIWASLPGAGYGQHENAQGMRQAAYAKAGSGLHPCSQNSRQSTPCYDTLVRLSSMGVIFAGGSHFAGVALTPPRDFLLGLPSIGTIFSEFQSVTH